MPKLKNSNTTFALIFKLCESFLTSLGYFPSKLRLFYNFICLVSRIALKSLKLTYLVKLCDREFQVFQNSPKLTILGIFKELLSKCKRSSFRSQSWMILFLWFSNTVRQKNEFTCGPGLSINALTKVRCSSETNMRDHLSGFNLSVRRV